MDSTLNNQSPYLITGLGNPGRQYKSNRHNIGFMLVNSLADRMDISFSRMESKALVVKHKYHERTIILAKPQTFMNLSGQAVGGLVKFYKIPLDNLLIVYDEVDLPLGVIRLRPSGGSISSHENGHRTTARAYECWNICAARFLQPGDRVSPRVPGSRR
jgi:aminoacyl-tRNA hydrolase